MSELQKKRTSEANTTHGDTNSPLHKKWMNMRNRCHNKNNSRFHSYGGRGIKVCEEWEDYNSFRKWATESGYIEGLTIERKDVNGNYEPDNCTWIPMIEQTKNTRRNVRLTMNGKTQNMSDWSRDLGIRFGTLWHRVKIGWDDEKALTTKVTPNGK